jgi:hypothetical protein
MRQLNCGLLVPNIFLLREVASFWNLRMFTKFVDVAEGVWPTKIELQGKAKVGCTFWSGVGRWGFRGAGLQQVHGYGRYWRSHLVIAEGSRILRNI